MDKILFLLLKKGAHLQPLKMSTTEIGRLCNMSQQNASCRIIRLEKSGLIEKNNQGIVLTKQGIYELYAVYSELKNIFGKKRIVLSGTILSGLGEGKYYMSLPEYKKQIKEKIGFEPYEGTLNILLSQIQIAKKAYLLKNLEPNIIKGFRKKSRTFGDIFLYPCLIEKRKCALIVPIRTHHPSKIIEIIAPFDIKRVFKKKNGDNIKIIFPVFDEKSVLKRQIQ